MLITPYDSIAEVAQAHYPAFPVKWLIHNPFDSKPLAKGITAQTLAFVAENDVVIPRGNSSALFTNFLETGVLRTVVIPNVGHNSIVSDAEFNKISKDFVR